MHFRNLNPRRVYVALLICGFILLIALRYITPFTLGHSNLRNGWEIFYSLLDTLIVAVAAAACTFGFDLWISDPTPAESGMRLINQEQLRLEYPELLEGTREFWYQGHTAKWTRSETLPLLARITEQNRESMDIVLILADPRSSRTCNHYSQFAHSAAIGATPLKPSQTAIDIIATILIFYTFSAHFPRLNVCISLIEIAFLTRVDLTSKAAIVTTPNHRKPALIHGAESPYYSVLREELNLIKKQARTLNPLGFLPKIESMNAPDARNFLSQAGLVLSESEITDNDLKQAIEVALELSRKSLPQS